MGRFYFVWTEAGQLFSCNSVYLLVFIFLPLSSSLFFDSSSFSAAFSSSCFSSWSALLCFSPSWYLHVRWIHTFIRSILHTRRFTCTINVVININSVVMQRVFVQQRRPHPLLYASSSIFALSSALISALISSKLTAGLAGSLSCSDALFPLHCFR